MLQKSALFFLTLFILSCSNSKTELPDCSLVDCDVADNTVYILFLDADTDENLLDNSGIPSENVLITDGTNEIAHEIVENTEMGTILYFNLNPADYGNKSFDITFEGGEPFTISFNTSYLEGECCGPFTGIDAIAISTYPNEYSTTGALPLNITLYID